MGAPPGEARERDVPGRALDHQLADADAAVDQPPVEGLGRGAVRVDGQPVGPPLPQPHPGQGRRQVGRRPDIGGGDQHPPGRPEQRRHPVWATSRPRSTISPPGCRPARPRPAGGWTGTRSGPTGDQLDPGQVPDLAHAVGSSRWSARPAPAAAAPATGRQPGPAAARVPVDQADKPPPDPSGPTRVRASSTAAAGRPVPVPRGVRGTARVVPGAAQAGGVEQRQVGPARQVGVEGRASTREPTWGRTSRAALGMGRPRTSIRPEVAKTRPSSIRTVVLPDPLKSGKPNRSPSRTSRAGCPRPPGRRTRSGPGCGSPQPTPSRARSAATRSSTGWVTVPASA